MAVIPVPRPDLKPHVPRIIVVQILWIKSVRSSVRVGRRSEASRMRPERRSISARMAPSSSPPRTAKARRARERVEGLTETAVVGRIYTGKVVRTTDFGAFVEILPNVDGMVHISQLDSERIEKVEDIVRVGDEITVMVTGIDPQGKIRLSRQAVLEGWTAEEAMARDRRGGGGGGATAAAIGDRAVAATAAAIGDRAVAATVIK